MKNQHTDHFIATESNNPQEAAIAKAVIKAHREEQLNFFLHVADGKLILEGTNSLPLGGVAVGGFKLLSLSLDTEDQIEVAAAIYTKFLWDHRITDIAYSSSVDFSEEYGIPTESRDQFLNECQKIWQRGLDMASKMLEVFDDNLA